MKRLNIISSKMILLFASLNLFSHSLLSQRDWGREPDEETSGGFSLLSIAFLLFFAYKIFLSDDHK